MNNPPSPSVCPRCGASLQDNSVQGLCARCLGALNFATDTASPDNSTEDVDRRAPPPISPKELAAHFPQLEIIEFLGRGGMGVVYKARQKSLGRLVALKLLAPERANDPQFAKRFVQEARSLAALNHPNIVTIHDFGQAGGFYYLLMEFIDGVNLRQAMNAGRLKPEQALAIVPPVCEALQYAHEHQIVHRDIKPENLLLDRAGRVKIADFGIAKMLDADSLAGLAESQPAGTPQYMAPEQRLHLQTDHRADIYSLGVVLYEMLTGELPQANLQPFAKRVQVDVRIDEIVLRALESKPELRFSTAAEFRSQVQQVTSVATGDLRHAIPFSRPAIVGACWVVVSLIAFVFGCFIIFRIRLGIGGSQRHGPSGQLMVPLVPALVLTCAGPLISTVLGWIAIRSIRRSNGRIRGMGLAIFDALLYPLIALNAVVVLAVTVPAKMFVDFYGNPATVGSQQGALVTRLANWVAMNSEVVILFAVSAGLIISFIIVQIVRRSVALPTTFSPVRRPADSDNETAITSISMLLALMSFLLGGLCVVRPMEGAWALLLLSLFMACLAILIALPMRRLTVSKSAIIIAGLGIMIWPCLAIVNAGYQSQTAIPAQSPVPTIRGDDAAIASPHKPT